jgi:hypothetical protein
MITFHKPKLKITASILIIIALFVVLRYTSSTSAQFLSETRSDINNDGVVDIFDLNSFISNFGKGKASEWSQDHPGYHTVLNNNYLILVQESSNLGTDHRGSTRRDGLTVELYSNGKKQNLESDEYKVFFSVDDDSVIQVQPQKETPNSVFSVIANNPGSSNVNIIIKRYPDLEVVHNTTLPVVVYDLWASDCAYYQPESKSIQVGEDIVIPIGSQSQGSDKHLNSSLAGYQYDFEGDGFFDTGVIENNAKTHSYNKPGTYSPIYRIVGTNNQLKDCPSNLSIIANGNPPVEPRPSAGKVSWKTDHISLELDDFQLIANGRVYTPPSDAIIEEHYSTVPDIITEISLSIKWVNDDDDQVSLIMQFNLNDSGWEYERSIVEVAKYFSWITFTQSSLATNHLYGNYDEPKLLEQKIIAHSDPELLTNKNAILQMKNISISVSNPN